jgi:hypothetical protein
MPGPVVDVMNAVRKHNGACRFATILGGTKRYLGAANRGCHMIMTLSVQLAYLIAHGPHLEDEDASRDGCITPHLINT